MWKDVERRYAELLQGIRIPVTGRGGQSDVLTPQYSVEVKSRKSLPGWLQQLRMLLSDHAALLLYTTPTDLPPVWLVCRTEQLLQQQFVVGFIIERSVLPGWIVKAVRQARLASRQEHRVPLVVIHEQNQRYQQDICILPEVEQCHGVSYEGSLLDRSVSTSPRKASRRRSVRDGRD